MHPGLDLEICALDRWSRWAGRCKTLKQRSAVQGQAAGDARRVTLMELGRLPEILCRRGAVDADVIIAPGLDVVHDFHIVH